MTPLPFTEEEIEDQRDFEFKFANLLIAELKLIFPGLLFSPVLVVLIVLAHMKYNEIV